MNRINLPNMKLGKKIMLLAIGAQLFLVSISAFLGFSALSSHRTLLAESTLTMLELTSANLSNSLTEIDALTYNILSDPVIQQELTNIAASDDIQQQLTSYHTLYNRLIRYEQESKTLGVRHIQLQTSAYMVLTTYQRPTEAQTTLTEELIRTASISNGQTVYHTGLRGENRLLAARSIRQVSPFTLSTTGTMVLDLDIDKLVSQATNDTAKIGSLYWILDNNGDSFYQSDALTEADIAVISASLSDDPHVISLHDGHYFMCHGTLKGQPDWGYTLLLSYETQWQTQIRSYLIMLLTLFGALILASLLSRATVRSITKEFDTLLDKMNSFQGELTENNAGVPVVNADAKNEIAILHLHFDRMAERIHTLIRERYVSELLTKEAQLQALEAQTNPHFLYNVLESINCRAKLAGNTDIATIVEALGRLLRVSLDKRSKMIPLQDELSLIHDYIAIQRQRYENQLNYQDHVPDDLLHIQIPKLAIQPLVENAIKYALENGIDDDCAVEVTAAVHQKCMIISVANTGSTFPEHMLGILKTDAMTTHGFGIGLTNIHRRLQLTYGDQGYLYLKNTNGMAVCELHIPLLSSVQGEQKHVENDHRG